MVKWHTSSSISLDLWAGVLCRQCSEDVKAEHHVSNTSLVYSTTMGTIAIPAPLGRLGLLLGVPLERWDRVLITNSDTSMLAMDHCLSNRTSSLLSLVLVQRYACCHYTEAGAIHFLYLPSIITVFSFFL